MAKRTGAVTAAPAPGSRDWEASARGRVERVLAGLVSDLRDAADDLEREGKHNLESAAKAERDYEWQGYPRVAGQAVHRLQTLIFNLKLDSLMDAAADAEAARTEKLAPPQSPITDHYEDGVKHGAEKALRVLLEEIDGWIEGARENHDALDHRGESAGDECWTRWAPADFRSMVNDAARRVGVAEFPKPKTVKEDEVR